MTCTAPLDGAKFFMHEGKAFCETCFASASFGGCAKCGLAMDGEIVQVGGRSYCASCFTFVLGRSCGVVCWVNIVVIVVVVVFAVVFFFKKKT